jgi:hypothetical protein
MPALACYATLPFLRRRQGLFETELSDDSKLLAKLRAATREIDNATRRSFQPVQEARAFDWESERYLGFRSFDLLKLTSIVDSLGTKQTDAIFLLGGTQSAYNAVGPFYGVELDLTKDYFQYLTTKMRAITVNGIWGWHDDYASAWIDSGVTVQSSLNSSATAITTSENDTNTADAWGRTWPSDANCGTVQIGHLIQIDSEWMQVVDYTDSTHLRVVRGANGTTAASHSTNAVISIYEPPADIQDICAQWAAYLNAQDSTDFGKVTIDAMGNKSIPPSLKGIKDKLDPYISPRVN